MKSLGLGRYALSISVAAILAGCGGSQPPIAAPGAMPQSRAIAAHAKRDGSWMLPEVKNRDLLYASGGCEGVCIFSYPGGKPVGSLSNFGNALCSDKRGNVFVPSSVDYGKGVVYEYARGGTAPIKTLDMGNETALGCSVDPRSGNLAVVSYGSPYFGVAIFENASGSPTYYTYSSARLLYAGSDDASNLFVDGYARKGSVFAELAKGSSTFVTISLNKKIIAPGQVQWDGKHITIETLRLPVVYRVQVSGSKAIIVGTTQLKEGNKQYVGQSWIQGKRIVAPCEGPTAKRPNSVCMWNYPAGGAGSQVLKHIAHGINAVTISVAPR